MKRIPPKVDLIYCRDRSARRSWKFPQEIAERIRTECDGQSILHLFGGQADFGIRMDIDPLTRPAVVADAWLPPFGAGTFDVVVMDPPYVRINSQERAGLFYTAAYIARRRVVWFHTHWVIPSCGLKLEASWAVVVGRSCAMRCLQIFGRTGRVITPMRGFARGPAVKYNRWLAGAMPLPFSAGPAEARII